MDNNISKQFEDGYQKASDMLIEAKIKEFVTRYRIPYTDMMLQGMRTLVIDCMRIRGTKDDTDVALNSSRRGSNDANGPR